jgi:hypothetical protein
MSRLAEALFKACGELDLQIEFDFILHMTNNAPIVAFAHIPCLGGRSGMLIFRTYDEVSASTAALHTMGYGYSVLDEPNQNESFDLESYKEMFIEWSWCCDDRLKPHWLK